MCLLDALFQAQGRSSDQDSGKALSLQGPHSTGETGGVHMLPKDSKNGRGWQRGCSGPGLGDPLRWDSPAAAWGLRAGNSVEGVGKGARQG